ncbi:hypothetical protein [Streptomyces sedi]|uniref:Uncharacterized protein n=1 Tax=Streptomyces sedi TaxID=555059 RepID=A0A5C4VCA9_9ACTN|nr:hypothetical protein [Streptomyces sedi]TNM33520.1 hypothetical protein FH715_03970 [Streptomyces sedi]
MWEEWRRRRAEQRVRPGDGRALQRFRWWQLLFRALFHLRLTRPDGGAVLYTVDVKHWMKGSSDEVKAQLYLDGKQHATSKLPARFPVPDGSVEVAMSTFGLKRCHYVTDAGAEHQLTPDRASAEGRRARFEHTSPGLSRALGRLSVITLIVSLALLLTQVAAPLSEIPAVAERVGTFSPPRLPALLNVALVLSTLLASMERALRLRYHWLLDGGVG